MPNVIWRIKSIRSSFRLGYSYSTRKKYVFNRFYLRHSVIDQKRSIDNGGRHFNAVPIVLAVDKQ